MDKHLHEWATYNNKNVTTIIAGHTHRAVFENLSITERRYLESKVKTEGIKIKQESDASYFNSGSCVHPYGITGLKICFADELTLKLIEWLYCTQENALTVKRAVLAG